jgi:alcohol dehydrogenase
VALAAASGYDALSHAIESLVSTRRTAISECFARAAWGLVNSGFEGVFKDSTDLEARGAVLLGAHFAGVAIENSNLGAAHACAYPLTDQCGIMHGSAVALVLPSVVEWNRKAAGARYEELCSAGLIARLRTLAQMAGLPANLREAGVPEEALPRLAEDAATQWTGKFNPRAFDAAGALEIYRMAY